MNNPALEVLLTRRSVLASKMVAPAPSASECALILKAAQRVPDHAKLGPWRYIIFDQAASERFGTVLEAAYLKNNPEAAPSSLEAERKRFSKAPMVICVVYSPKEHPKAPAFEQILSVGASCQNILLAAHALGYAGQWLTQWPAFDADVCQALGLTAGEQVAGFIYLGTAIEPPSERDRPSLDERVSYY